MDNINLLDLNDEVFSLIGDYVKIDNWEGIKADYFKRRGKVSELYTFKYVDVKVKKHVNTLFLMEIIIDHL